MKGAVAAMVVAAAALQETGTKLHGDLILSFVADEEGRWPLGIEVSR
jgi:acetylornithine deacetylase/succinyl-diaminopimelate desuccinylase-like protein